jgi:hypothetical protein
MKSSLLSFYNIERRVCCIYTFEVDIWDWQQRHEMSSVLTSRSCLLAITEEKRRNLLFWGLRAKPCVDRSIKSPLAIVCNGEIENIRLVARHLVSNLSNSFFPLIPVEFSNSSRVVPHSFVTRQLCLSFKIKMCLEFWFEIGGIGYTRLRTLPAAFSWRPVRDSASARIPGAQRSWRSHHQSSGSSHSAPARHHPTAETYYTWILIKLKLKLFNSINLWIRSSKHSQSSCHLLDIENYPIDRHLFQRVWPCILTLLQISVAHSQLV